MEQSSIPRLLLRMSPPVMLALLIQSIYNIVDSYYVARYSGDGLTALSIIFPVQLLMTALAAGTGAGLNILVSRMDGEGRNEEQPYYVKIGLLLGLLNYLLFAALGLLALGPYFAISSGQAAVREMGISYGRIILLGSFGQFLEANCTKLLQAKGNMVTPMAAQIAGALVNVILDPVLIFGLCGIHKMGIAGAAIATVLGQILAMGITLAAVRRRYMRPEEVGCQLVEKEAKKAKEKAEAGVKAGQGVRGREPTGIGRLAVCGVRIYRAGLPSMLMQSLYTLYIIGLNLILKGFTEDAVTVLGIYYKLQTFFFIPMMGLQQVILPVISYNYGAGRRDRVKDTLKYAVLVSCGIMLPATLVFMAAPECLLGFFSDSKAVLAIGGQALPVIAGSFLPAGLVMMLTVYAQGVDRGGVSIWITVLRQVFLLVPLAWVFHFAGLRFVWYTFPVTEIIAAIPASFFAISRSGSGRRK